MVTDCEQDIKKSAAKNKVMMYFIETVLDDKDPVKLTTVIHNNVRKTNRFF
jgi:hypothetical protein